MFKSVNQFTWLMGAAIVGLLTLLFATSCLEEDTATTPASCAFITGDGQGSRDADLHYVVLPGQQYDRDQDEEYVSYVPCNSRNFIVSDGTVRDANGEVVGDRKQPIIATTSGGIEIEVAVTAYWTLNQSNNAIFNFYRVCQKYNCASPNDVSGEANNSTPGWNDMLGENFGPALERAVKLSVFKANSTLLERRDPEEFKRLADSTSLAFMDEVRAALGYPEDLFCGSGNSIWSNPDEPGKGTFDCKPVRIAVDNVRKAPVNENQNTVEGQKLLNQQRLDNAIAVYGPDAGWWLALLDVIDKCKSAGPTCIINIGDANAPAVPLPSNSLPGPLPATPSP